VGEYVKTTSTINSAPRFDHDPETGESLGLLVEESRTNLLLRSEEFDTTWSTSDVSVFANQTIAPDGNTTADKLVCGTGTPFFQGITQSITATASATRFSVYVKAAEIDQVELRSFSPTDLAIFELSTQQVLSQSGSPAPTITDAGNGWYRCSITSSSSGVTSFRISLVSGGTRTFTPISGAGIYLWGAQLEVGSFPTSYIPTTSSTVTRAADVASISGSNFSSWYRQDEGTVFADAEFPRIGVRSIWMLNNAANNVDTIDTHFNNNLTFRARKASANLFGATINTASDRNKTSFAFMDNNFGASANGELSPATGSGTISVPTFLEIGSAAYAGLSPLNGTIRRLVYWGQRLPDSTLVNITT
jgi:hypothetical protein